MPLLSLSRFLGHSDLQTTQRYIDGADPKVRDDYEKAFAAVMNPSTVVESSSASNTESSEPSSKSSIFQKPTVVRQVPDSFDASKYLERLPEWMHQDCEHWIQERWLRWKPSRRQGNASTIIRKLVLTLRWWSEKGSFSCWKQLKKSDIQAYIDHCFSRKLAAETVKTALNVLFNFLRYLKRKERLFSLPERPRIELPEPLPRHIEPRELLRLEQVVAAEREKEDGDKLAVVIYYMLAHGGLRLCEILDLEYQAIELEARKVRIDEGKGRRDRVSYLTQTGCEVLQEYFEQNPRVRGDLVLSIKGKAMSGQQVWSRVKKLGEKAGIDNLYPQRLRHTYATTLLNNGMSLEVLQKLMGHDNINTTLIYARLADKTVEQQYQNAMQVSVIKDINLNSKQINSL